MYVSVSNTVNVTGLRKYKVCFGDLQIFIKNFVKLLIWGELGRLVENFGVDAEGRRGRGAGKKSGTAAACGGRRGSGSSGYCLKGAGLCRLGLDVSVVRVGDQ